MIVKYNPKSPLNPNGFNESKCLEKLNKNCSIELSKGRCYVVYAIVVDCDCRWFCVADDLFCILNYPVFYPEFFFSIVNDQGSKYWKDPLWKKNCPIKSDYGSIFSIKEWAKDGTFYSRLVDGESKELSIFLKMKELMDLEYPITSGYGTAKILHNEWVLCEKCDEVWQNSNSSGMIRCPKCKTLLINPFFSDGCLLYTETSRRTKSVQKITNNAEFEE